ncbi:hypothetical protein DEO23_01875 [Brachybacterium endophyticum]|uniref:Glycosyl hydrolase family 30 TIM-barrel domain-containing protein n=1 Tax=Brachybacterium endophyticum TaxID=2182385 RepID=A0A2U2RNG6_9MICO|nr:hypothetical protein [Brachybacterium endophyticum]PWH07413.1 hypothetical protein DEO23_01875 [Brachybacterium endophyticum]
MSDASPTSTSRRRALLGGATAAVAAGGAAVTAPIAAADGRGGHGRGQGSGHGHQHGTARAATGVPIVSIPRQGGVIATSPDPATMFTALPASTEVAPTVIDVGAPLRGRRIEGFGGALTHSAATLLLQMGTKRRSALLTDLFSPTGAHRLNALRIPLGTSDFTTDADYYTFADWKGPSADPLRHLSIERDEASILPVLREILAINPQLTVLMSPWSAPAWMKTSGSLIGGSLHDDARTRALYAEYLARSVQEYRRRVRHLEVAAISVQNEPLHGEAQYPCMTMTADEQVDVIARTQDALARHHQSTEVYVYDHNWDHPEYPIEVLDGLAAKRRDAWGVGFHAYGGDAASAGDAVQEAHPGARIWLTEQTGTRNLEKSYPENFAECLSWMSTNLFLPSLAHRHRGVILFNLVLDEDGGPGPSTFTNGTGLVQWEADGTKLTPNAELLVMSHFSRFVTPGSQLVETSVDGEGLLCVGARSGGRDVVVVHNNREPRDVSVRRSRSVRGHVLTAKIPAVALATFVLGEGR